MEIFEVITDAKTGEQTIRPYTAEEIAAREAAAAAVTVPASITPRQCRLVLYGQGLLDQVETMIKAQPRPVQLAWEYASEFKRDDQLLEQLAKGLGLSDAQLDAFFVAAATL